MADRDTQERVARNEATFREANDRIERAAETHALKAGAVPFICECADTSCTTLVQLTLDDYRHVRSHGRWFVVAAGHEDDPAPSDLVERHGDYVILEKREFAGEIAEKLADG